jgi:hypothetical protein
MITMFSMFMVLSVHKPFIVERREDPLFVINDHPSTSRIYARF